jgi:hypothetical protein
MWRVYYQDQVNGRDWCWPPFRTREHALTQACSIRKQTGKLRNYVADAPNRLERADDSDCEVSGFARVARGHYADPIQGELNDMDPFYSFLQVKCAACQEPLIRIAQSETDDRVVCPICFAVGDYERVIKQGSGLSRGGIFVTDETKSFIDQLRRRRDRLL